MRQGIPALLLALSPCLMAAPVLAEEVTSSVLAIDDALFGKHTELQNATDATKLQKVAVDNQQAELNRLTQQAKALDAALKTAKTNLERDYQKMIDDRISTSSHHKTRIKPHGLRSNRTKSHVWMLNKNCKRCSRYWHNTRCNSRP